MGTELSYKAVPFQAPEGAEIMGKVVKSYFVNLAQETFAPVLEKYDLHLEDIDEDEWYTLQLYYDIDMEIYKNSGGSSALVAIGKATMANLLSQLPYKSIGDYFDNGLNSIATRAYLRNVPAEFGFIVSKLGEKHYRISSNLPASNETVYGSLWEACRILSQEGESFTVKPVEGYPGNDICATFEVYWG